MGVHDRARYPWLAAEKRVLERALGAGCGPRAGETGGGPYSQTAAEILAAPLARYAALERHLAALPGRLVD